MSLIQQSFKIYTQHAASFLAIIAIPAVLAGVASFFEPAQDETVAPGIAVTYLVFFLISSVVGIFMTLALVYKSDNLALTLNEAYALSAKKFFKYVLFTIVLSLVLILAFILLIIPGIWLSVSFSFAMFFLLLENKGIRESMKASFALVKGKWWYVLGMTLLLALIMFAVAIVFGIVSSVLAPVFGADFMYGVTSAVMYTLMPFCMVYMYLLFKKLQSKQDQPVTE